MKDWLGQISCRSHLILYWALSPLVGRRSPPANREPTALVIGAYGNGNFGDDAVGDALCGLLETVGVTDVVLGMRLHRPVSWTRAGVACVVLGSGLPSLWRTYRLARRCSVCILGGGGLFEGSPHDVRSATLAAEYAMKALVGRAAGARLVVLGLGVNAGPFAARAAERPIATALRRATAVVVRSQASLVGATRRGAAHAVCLPDPALLVLSGFRSNERAVGVTLIDAIRWPRFIPGSPDAEEERRRKLEATASTVLRLGQPDDPIVLVPFHHSDVGLLAEFAAILRSMSADRLVREVEYDGTSYLNQFRRFAGCRMTFAQRFHPGLSATAAGSALAVDPVLPKLRSIAEQLGPTGPGLHEAYALLLSEALTPATV